ncbi:MAG TPA: ATP-binding protein [Enhygromyxa sp.]|nr:ATP-binding protein [Enhygromyxa sp.]
MWPLALERGEGRVTIVHEREQGVALERLAGAKGLAVEPFLPIALALVQTLAELHGRGLLHDDLRPCTLYFDAPSQRVQIGPPGLPILLDCERAAQIEAGELEAVLPYLAPELDRHRPSADVRSDLYSLGACFHRVLSGRPPFVADSPSGYRHVRRTRVPRALPGVPPWLAAIVAKLLAKAPRDRYQSAAGLLADLRRFAEAHTSGVEAPEFVLGVDDRPTMLMRSGDPHGREPQLRELGRELAQAHDSGRVRTIVVHGPAGVGKSTLLECFDETVAVREGLFGLARFERDAAPHAALLAAIDHMVAQLGTHAAPARARMVEHLRGRLGSIAAVVAERVPSFPSVASGAVPKLNLHAERRRFELALSRLLEALGERAPLALALDNLEDASADDLALLRVLLRASTPMVVLLGCADPALEPGQPIATWLSELERGGIELSRMRLEALRRDELVEWVTELLGSKAVELGSLGGLIELLDRRTRRLPGPLWCYLEQLDERELIKSGVGGWSWDMHAIDRAALASDADARIDAARERLPSGDLELLELAAAIGERFDVQVLARASEREPTELLDALDRLRRVGLVVRERGELRFGFAWGVRAASYTRVAPSRRRYCLLAVALALDSTSAGDMPTAAAVLRAGGAEALAQLDAPQRERLAKRCAAAGRVALASGAWTVAHAWLGVAIDAVESGASDIDLRCDHAVALGLGPAPEHADAAFEQLLERPLALAEHARVVAARVQGWTVQGRWREAIDLGLAALTRCGVHLRRSPGVAAIVLAVGRGYLSCRELDLESLRSSQPIEAEVAASLVIADSLVEAAYFDNPRLWVLLAALRAQRTARAGLHLGAPQALAHFAVALATVLRQTEDAARLCDLAVALCDVIEGAEAHRARAMGAGALAVWPMTRPLSGCVEGLIACQQHAFELGDEGIASLVSTAGLGLCFHAGVPLPEVRLLGASWRAQLERWSSASVLAAVDAWIEFLAALIGPRSETSPSLVADLELAEAGVGEPIRYALALNGALALWLLGERDAAAERLEPLVDQLEQRLFGSWQIPPGAVMLAIIANQRAGKRELERRVAGDRIRIALRLARRFARSSWTNFGAHVELIIGERERLRGRVDRALEAYERARELAADGDNPCMQALACDRLANLALASERRATARGAAVTAVAVLRRWGAEAAARQLELEYAELLAVGVPSARTTMHWLRPTLAAGRQRTTLDAARVLEVMHTISEELRFEEVVARVIGSAVATPGSERAVLLLEHEGTLGVVAHGDGHVIDEFVAHPILLSDAAELIPRTVIEHTFESGALLVIDDASTDLRFAGDPYLQRTELGSLLCMPIARNTDRNGVLLIENRVASGAFPPERVEVLRILLTRAASALSHARLYEALQRSEVLFRSLVDGVPDMISLMDRSGRIEFINHLGDFELAPSALVGVDSTLLLDPSSGPQWRAALEHVGTTGEPQALEIRANLPGGYSRWYSIRLNALEFGGKIGKLISIATDITARKLAEADKLRLEAQLRQQQRLESVGTLASGVAHEINNPIQGIMNYADLILARAHDKELVVDFTAEILTESERIATIVRNLLAFSRQEAEQTPELCAVQRLIDATLSLIRAVVRKDDIELRIDVPEDLHEIRCRPQQLQQIIMNLVANSRDALNERHRDGGRKTIEIRARNFERGGRDWVRISVEDCGTGIPEHIRARIFDPFFTTKGRDQGTGLGLAVSHGIAVEHGGELWVESELGVGSTFHLDLPAHADELALEM